MRRRGPIARPSHPLAGRRPPPVRGARTTVRRRSHSLEKTCERTVPRHHTVPRHRTASRHRARPRHHGPGAGHRVRRRRPAHHRLEPHPGQGRRARRGRRHRGRRPGRRDRGERPGRGLPVRQGLGARGARPARRVAGRPHRRHAHHVHAGRRTGDRRLGRRAPGRLPGRRADGHTDDGRPARGAVLLQRPRAPLRHPPRDAVPAGHEHPCGRRGRHVGAVRDVAAHRHVRDVLRLLPRGRADPHRRRGRQGVRRARRPVDQGHDRLARPRRRLHRQGRLHHRRTEPALQPVRPGPHHARQRRPGHQSRTPGAAP